MGAQALWSLLVQMFRRVLGGPGEDDALRLPPPTDALSPPFLAMRRGGQGEGRTIPVVFLLVLLLACIAATGLLSLPALFGLALSLGAATFRTVSSPAA
jgi:hypothetical protein